MIIGLTEMWMERGAWRKISDKLGNKFKWNHIPAVKEKKRRRVKGGIVTAINKKIKGIQVREINKKAMEIKFVHNRSRWTLIVLYSQNMEET